jgi:hypothetical protein
VDWLIHNPIGDMYGPMFLLVYALAAVLIIATCDAWASGTAQARGMPPRRSPATLTLMSLPICGVSPMKSSVPLCQCCICAV